MPESRVYRIFISSPSDVFPERERIERVIARLNGELGGRTTLQAIRWESTYYTADRTFQDQIVQASQTDLVICILWKRLGAELPPAYRRPDGTTPTGTEYEFEDAIAAARANGTPDVLVYRKSAAVLLDADNIDLERAQFEALKTFWLRWFQTETGRFTAAYESFETTDGFEQTVEAHIRQWLVRNKAELTDAVTWSIALRGSPFRGLQSFDEDHADVFFGRRRVVEQIREALVAAADRGTPFLLLAGTSGSGKSSIVRAGLIPRIARTGAIPGVDLWRRCVFRPSEGGGDPSAGLARALYRADVLPELGEGDNPTPADFAALLRAAPDAAARAVRAALARAARVVAKREGFDRPVEARLLLVADQFEEALTGPAESVDRFGLALTALVGQGNTWVIGTLRSDFYAAFQRAPSLVALKAQGVLVDVLPPTPGEIADIVIGPALAAGLSFERRKDGLGLDDELIAAAAMPGSLPLLQLALDELFTARDPHSNTLGIAAYDALGGLAGVVERRAEQTLSGLDPEAASALPRLLAALVDVADDGIITSRPALRSDIETVPGAGRLVEAFATARLLVLEARDGAPVVRVAHESLIAGWPRAQSLIAADRDALRVRGRVAEAARRWRREDRHPDYLLPSGRPLAEASDLAARRPDQLTDDMRVFLSDSLRAEAARSAEAQAQAERALRLQSEAAEARAEAALRIARRTRIAVVLVSLLLVLVAGAGGLAWSARQQAQRRAILAERNFSAALNLASQLSTGATLIGADDYRGAVTAYREGLAIVSRIVGQDPEARGYYALRRTGAVLHRAIGRALLLAGDTAEGEKQLDESLAQFRALLIGAPAEAEVEDDLIVTEQVIAAALFLRGDVAGAVVHLRDGVAVAEPVVMRDTARVELALKIAETDRIIGDNLWEAHDGPGALAAYESGQRVAQRFRTLKPDDPRWLQQISETEGGVGYVLFRSDKPAEALPRLEAALEASRQATVAKPNEAGWQHVAISADQTLAMALEAKGDFASALDHATAALNRAEALSGRDPASKRWQLDVALAHTYVGVALKLLGRTDEAKGHFDLTQALMAKAKGKPPT